MSKRKLEIVANPVEESRRYVDNARDVLQKHGNMLNAVFHVNEEQGM